MAKPHKYFPWFIIVILCISVILLYMIQSSWNIRENFENSSYNIKYYVITLGNSNRIENIQKQTDKLNHLNPETNPELKITLQKIDAINGDDLNLDKLVQEGKIAEEVVSKTPYRGLYGGLEKRKYEVGCYLSHIRAYETIQNGIKNGEINPDDYSIIFEDDFEVKDNYFTELKKGLDYLIRNKPDFDILFLGLHSETNDPVGSNIYHPNCKNIFNCFYAHAYLINNRKIDKIIQEMSYMYDALDITIMDLSEKGKFNVYRIMPDIVNQNSPTTGSEIRNW